MRLLEVNRGSCFRLVTRRVFLPVALRERRRVARVHGTRTRLRWLARLRNPYARRASSLASRFMLSETEIRDSGQERGDDFVFPPGYRPGQGQQLGDVVVLRAPVVGGKEPAADVALARDRAGDAGGFRAWRSFSLPIQAAAISCPAGAAAAVRAAHHPAAHVPGHLDRQVDDVEQVRHQLRARQHPAPRGGVDGAHVDRDDPDRVPPGGDGLRQPVRGVIGGAPLHLPQQALLAGQVKEAGVPPWVAGAAQPSPPTVAAAGMTAVTGYPA